MRLFLLFISALLSACNSPTASNSAIIAQKSLQSSWSDGTTTLDLSQSRQSASVSGFESVCLSYSVRSDGVGVCDASEGESVSVVCSESIEVAPGDAWSGTITVGRTLVSYSESCANAVQPDENCANELAECETHLFPIGVYSYQKYGNGLRVFNNSMDLNLN